MTQECKNHKMEYVGYGKMFCFVCEKEEHHP